jgi:hypothetical protein
MGPMNSGFVPKMKQFGFFEPDFTGKCEIWWIFIGVFMLIRRKAYE